MNKKIIYETHKEGIDEFSFIRLASFSVDVSIGDVWGNAEKIVKCAEKASLLNCNIVSFQALVLTGSACGSLFLDNFFLENAKKALFYVAEKTKQFSSIFFVGLPIKQDGLLYNAVSCIYKGTILFINVLTPVNLQFFNEYKGDRKRLEKDILFASNIVLRLKTISGLAVSLQCISGECLFDSDGIAGIEIVFSNISSKAGYDELGLYSNISNIRKNAILISSPSITETNEQSVYSSFTAILEKGEVLDHHSIFNEGFSYADVDVELLSSNVEGKEDVLLEIKDFASIEELKRPISPLPFISFLPPLREKITSYIFSLFTLQVKAINVRLKSIGIEKIVLGVSGGLDSTMALLFCIASFRNCLLPIDNIHCFTLPCFGTTEHTKSNAISLCEVLHCSIEEISIKDSVLQHFKDIGQDDACFDVTFENAQARERTQVLMDKANQLGAIVLGSSDLSEIALGFSTYNGDHMAMYNINAAIPKTILRLCLEYAIEHPDLFLVEDENKKAFQNILSSILNTPISPELLPARDGKITQKTEEILGSYELQDFFIYHICFNHYPPKKVLVLSKKVFPKLSYSEISTSLSSFYRRFFKSQFKRNCSPEGINATGFSLSSWKMPSNVSGLSFFYENTKNYLDN
ncbi:MAG: NAD(+) synthase [Treponema sp.]